MENKLQTLLAKHSEEISEAGDMHNEDCCVHFPEDSRACDVGTGTLDCCENMRFIHTSHQAIIRLLVEEIEGRKRQHNENCLTLTKVKLPICFCDAVEIHNNALTTLANDFKKLIHD